ncbi:MAG TPA: aminoglycoside adenylyltransferase domain-containing protein [Symbiobacteriaceae bacterium]|nr:aminoglycoside adenylyltransferase domain-containing protein [Symbiobacteriaceae bacterium]
MPARAEYPTPHSDVNALIDRLLESIRAILGDRFAGMYLHGSLAIGDFDPVRSDVDFLVATAGVLPEDAIRQLAAMHAGVSESDLPWKTNYEGSYIPLAALRRYDRAGSVHPAVEVDGHFGLAGHGSDWIIQRHVIRERGVVVSGPSPDRLIDPISADDLRQAARQVLVGRWAPEAAEPPARLAGAEYQAYAVLTMCRGLYTIHFGEVASKPQAARWALQRLDSRWASLIRQALAWRHGLGLDAAEETREFIRHTLNQISVEP